MPSWAHRVCWPNLVIVAAGTLIFVIVCREMIGLGFWTTQLLMLPLAFLSGALVPILKDSK